MQIHLEDVEISLSISENFELLVKERTGSPVIHPVGTIDICFTSIHPVVFEILLLAWS